MYNWTYQWQPSVHLWGCSRNHPPWTMQGWAVAGSQTTGSTSDANRPCPVTPGNTWMVPWITVYSTGWQQKKDAPSSLPHLEDFFCLFFIFRRLNFWFQGLVLQNGSCTEGASCKLTWSQLSIIKPQYCTAFWRKEELQDIPLLWTWVAWKAMALGLWDGVQDLVFQPQRVKPWFLGWHFLSLCLVFWLPDGMHTSVGGRNSVFWERRRRAYL